ncbi:MAG: phospholipase D family protein [Bacteroidales bacterium]|nr:phospholipase D family protein [Bacteroidales bacterium]
MIVKSLEKYFYNEIEDADEVLIAVGLISENKAKEIIKLAEENEVLVKLIVGIDMPTPNSALKLLKKASKTSNYICVKYYKEESSFFHPKVYLFSSNGSYTAFVGSANYTESGFSKNCELAIRTENPIDCKSIKKWFDSLWNKECDVITEELIVSREYELINNPYRPLPKMNKVKRNTEHIEKFNAENIIADLKELRNNNELYSSICTQRKNAIKDLRRCLDVNNGFAGFRGQAVDDFCSEGSLGDLNQHGVPNAMHSAERNGTLKNLCKLLSDETIPIKNRVSRALKMVPGVGKGSITKILTTLYPKKYILINGCSLKYLKLPPQLSSGKCYEEYCEFGQDLLKILDIDNFAVLDGMIRYLTDGDTV